MFVVSRKSYERFCFSHESGPFVDKEFPNSMGFWTAASLYSPLKFVSIVPMDNTMLSGDTVIRGGDPKPNPPG